MTQNLPFIRNKYRVMEVSDAVQELDERPS